MNISEHFTLEEMTRTLQEWGNVPLGVEVINICRVVLTFLEPLRMASGRLDVTSGFRCTAVNREVGGRPSSFHVPGLAVDFHSDKWTPMELMAKAHRMELPYDKMIAEDNGKSKWLHAQIQPVGIPNRFERYHANMINGEMVYKKVN